MNVTMDREKETEEQWMNVTMDREKETEQQWMNVIMAREKETEEQWMRSTTRFFLITKQNKRFGKISYD